MPAGRPTQYRPEYCDDVIEWGKQGKSKTWIASEIGVTRETLYEWERVHPEFSDAMARAKVFEQRWWEDAGQDGMKLQGFGQSIWSRSMAARFPKEWREKTAHVGGDEGDNPIKQEVTLGADAFTRAITGLTARSGEGGTSGSSE